MLTRLEGMARWAHKRACRLGLVLPQGVDTPGYRPTPRPAPRPLTASELAYRALDEVIDAVNRQYRCGVNLQTDEQMAARWFRGWTDATMPPYPRGRILCTGLIAWHAEAEGLAPLQAYLPETAWEAVKTAPYVGFRLADALLVVASTLSFHYHAGICAAQWSVVEQNGQLLPPIEQLAYCEPGFCRGACAERAWAWQQRRQVDQIIDARAWLASGGRLVAILPTG